MKGRATEGGGARPGELRAVSHFMKAPAAVALLRDQYGDANAWKVALTEQRRAKRARSKKRFAFWADVAARIARRQGSPGEGRSPPESGHSAGAACRPDTATAPRLK